MSAGVCPIVSLVLLAVVPSSVQTPGFAVAVGTIGVLFGLHTAWLVGRLVTEPIGDLTAAARSVSRGDLGVTIDMEFTAIGDAVNVAARVEGLPTCRARYNARLSDEAGRDAMPKVIKPATLAAPMGLYSPGMTATGEIVVVAGMTGIDANSRIAGPDVESQTKQVFSNIRAVVEAAGCTMRDVVRLQTFLTSVDDIPGFMKARKEVFARDFPDGVYPTNTLLVVTRLADPELVVEVEAMAVKPTRVAALRAPSRAKRPARRRTRR